MIKLKILTLFILFSISAFGIDCTASNRYVNTEGDLIQSEIQLTKTFDANKTLQFSGELNGQYYFFTYDLTQEDGLLQIVDANDNTKGIVSRSAFNKQGLVSLSLVDNQIVHRLQCKL
jgi:hypothetical protein